MSLTHTKTHIHTHTQQKHDNENDPLGINAMHRMDSLRFYTLYGHKIQQLLLVAAISRNKIQKYRLN